MTTISFWFAIKLPQTTSNTTSTSKSQQCNWVKSPATNELLTETCGGTNQFAYYGDGATNCNSLYTVTSGGGWDSCCFGGNYATVGNTSTCTSNNSSGTACANYTLSNGVITGGSVAGYPYQKKGNCGYGQATTCNYNYNCYTPTSSNYVTNPSPTSGPIWSSFYYSGGSTTSSASTPSYSVFFVSYNLADFTTAAQIESAISIFISTTAITNLNTAQGISSDNNNSQSMAFQNIQAVEKILSQFCSSSASNLTSAPCNQYCGFTTGSIAASISNTTNNCVPAYMSYCDNASIMGTTECLDFYSNQNINKNYNYGTFLTSQCANTSFYINPVNSDSPYTYAEGVPSICYCYPPQNVLTQYYKAIDNALELSGLPPGVSSLATCSYSPCTSNIPVKDIASANQPACPSSNLQICLNQINSTGSTINVGSMSDNCSQSVTNSNTYIGDTPSSVSTSAPSVPSATSAPSASSVPSVPSATSAPSTPSAPSSSTSTSPPLDKKWLLIGFVIFVIGLLFCVGIYYVFFTSNKPSASSPPQFPAPSAPSASKKLPAPSASPAPPASQAPQASQAPPAS